MTIVAVVEAVALVIVVFLLLRHSDVRERAWEAERHILLERVQRPERPPVLPAGEFIAPEPEPDEFAQVGTIADLSPDDFDMEHP